MTKRLRVLVVGCVALSMGVPFVREAEAQSSSVINVNSNRPVYAALVELERSQEFAITYEDPFVVFDGDLKYTSDRPRVDGVRRMMKAKGGDLKIVYSAELNHRPERALELIQEVLRQASIAGYKFSVRQVGPKSFHVFPSFLHDEKGVEQPYRPLLDTAISLPAKSRSGLEFLNDVLRRVRDIREVNIRYWEIPYKPLKQQTLSIGAQNERAADLIRRVFPQGSTWSLECVPRHACFFNVVPFQQLPNIVHP